MVSLGSAHTMSGCWSSTRRLRSVYLGSDRADTPPFRSLFLLLSSQLALDALEIHAPLAHRLGVHHLSGCLEDLAFKALYPSEYEQVRYSEVRCVKRKNARRKHERQAVHSAVITQAVYAFSAYVHENKPTKPAVAMTSD